MASCPVRAEQVLESHGRPLRITLSRPSDCAKYEITLDVALHFGPEDHSCAEKLNKNNDQVGRETLQLFKSGLTNAGPPARFGVPGRSTHEQRGASSLGRCHTLFIQTTSAEAALGGQPSGAAEASQADRHRKCGAPNQGLREGQR